MALDAAIAPITHQPNDGNADMHKVQSAIAPTVKVEGVKKPHEPSAHGNLIAVIRMAPSGFALGINSVKPR